MPSDGENPQLILDEGLFLQAIKTLHELEGGFELLNAVLEPAPRRVATPGTPSAWILR